MKLSNREEIGAYMVCGNCLQERPAGTTPRDWTRFNVGWTRAGLQVWCVRCDLNVINIDFEGQKHPANCTANKTPK